MKRILIAVMLVLSLLLVPSSVSAATGVTVIDRTGDGVWDGSAWQVELFPGEVKSTTLTLYNSSSSSLDVEVSIQPDSLDNGNLAFELGKSSFEMSGGSHEDITLTVRASGSAAPGTYTTELTIKSEVPPAVGGGGAGGRDTKPPRVYDISVSGISGITATICWTTNEKSTSQVEYWSSPSKFSPLDETYVTFHSVTLMDLALGTTYEYKVMSEDKAGNLAVSEECSFTTLGEKPTEPEPIIPEPEEPEPFVPEPEEPVEPEIVEPEVVEPEVVEIEKVAPWGLIGGILGGLVVLAGGATYWLRRKRAVERR